MAKVGLNPPPPLSDTHFNPHYYGPNPGAHPSEPPGPGSSALEAVLAFRKRVQSVVQNATPRFRAPKE